VQQKGLPGTACRIRERERGLRDSDGEYSGHARLNVDATCVVGTPAPAVHDDLDGLAEHGMSVSGASMAQRMRCVPAMCNPTGDDSRVKGCPVVFLAAPRSAGEGEEEIIGGAPNDQVNKKRSTAGVIQLSPLIGAGLGRGKPEKDPSGDQNGG
jgi:hypothetical protein